MRVEGLGAELQGTAERGGGAVIGTAERSQARPGCAGKPSGKPGAGLRLQRLTNSPEKPPRIREKTPSVLRVSWVHLPLPPPAL